MLWHDRKWTQLLKNAWFTHKLWKRSGATYVGQEYSLVKGVICKDVQTATSLSFLSAT